MPENQVEIVFKTTAELQGAIAAQNELEKTRGKLLALGKDTLEVDAQLARANALVAQAPPEMLQAAQLEQQAEGFGKLTLHGRDFHRVLHQITEASPGLGVALRAFINPATAGFAALVIGIQYFRDQLKEAEAALKLGGAWEDFSKIQQKIGEDFDAGLHSALAYQRQLEATAGAMDKLKSSTETEIGLIQEKAREEDAERSGDLALKKAEIDAKRKSGLIDEVEAIKEKNALENQFAREKIERETKAAREVIAARQRERAGVRAAVPEAEAEAAGAERGLLLAETPAAIKARQERARANAKAAEEEVKQAQAGAEGLAGTLAGPAAETRLQNARAAMAASKALLQAEIDSAFEREENYRKLDEAMKRARARLEELRKTDAALGAAIEKSLFREIYAGPSRERVERTGEKTRATELAGEMGAVTQKESPRIAAAAAEAGGLLGAGGVSKAEALAQSIEDKGLRGNQEAILQVIERFTGVANGIDAGNQQLLRLVNQRLADLERQIAANRVLQN